MYEEKSGVYFDNIRTDLLELIPEKNRQGAMLEVGAGTGCTLLYAKEKGFAASVFGVELFAIKDSSQNSAVLSEFIIGDVEKIDLPFENEKFDVIICGDVLEHLIDAGLVLRKLKQYLKKDGVFITSIPNIRELEIMKTIFFKGDFHYADSGILDRTHLRFFTKKNMLSLFADNGFIVQSITGKNDAANSIKRAITRYLFSFKLIKFVLALFFPEFLHRQYLIVAQKID